MEKKLKYSEKCGQIRVRSMSLNGQSSIESVGWGANIDGNDEPSKYLRKLNMKTIYQKECTELYPGHPEFDGKKRCGKSLTENAGFARVTFERLEII